MTARERDARVARAMGWTVRRGTFEYDGVEKAWMVFCDLEGRDHNPIPFTTDHNAAQQAISEVERRGLWAEYVQCLAYGIDAPPIATMSPDVYPSYRVWLLLRATTDQCCESAVKVLEGQPNARQD